MFRILLTIFFLLVQPYWGVNAKADEIEAKKALEKARAKKQAANAEPVAPIAPAAKTFQSGEEVLRALPAALNPSKPRSRPWDGYDGKEQEKWIADNVIGQRMTVRCDNILGVPRLPFGEMEVQREWSITGTSTCEPTWTTSAEQNIGRQHKSVKTTHRAYVQVIWDGLPSEEVVFGAKRSKTVSMSGTITKFEIQPSSNSAHPNIVVRLQVDKQSVLPEPVKPVSR